MLKVEHNLNVAIKALRRWEKALSRASINRALEHMADRVVEMHRRAIDEGGHDFPGRDGPSWEPTSQWWVKRLSGKTDNKPLKWTGEAQRSFMRTRASGGKVDIKAIDYLGRFQFGPFEQTETFQVIWEGVGKERHFIKLRPGESGGTPHTKTIRIHQREVFYVDPSDADAFLDRLAAEMGEGANFVTGDFGFGGF